MSIILERESFISFIKRFLLDATCTVRISFSLSLLADDAACSRPPSPSIEVKETNQTTSWRDISVEKCFPKFIGLLLNSVKNYMRFSPSPLPKRLERGAGNDTALLIKFEQENLPIPIHSQAAGLSCYGAREEASPLIL